MSCCWALSGCSKGGGHSPAGARGLTCFHCGAWALGMWAQKLWCTGPMSPRHVESSWTKDQTSVPCIRRQTRNHWMTREVPTPYYLRITDAYLPGNLRFLTTDSWRVKGQKWRVPHPGRSGRAPWLYFTTNGQVPKLSSGDLLYQLFCIPTPDSQRFGQTPNLVDFRSLPPVSLLSTCQ